jgi:FAD/FMN-containing dehydrogenase
MGIITKVSFRILEKPKYTTHMTFGWKREHAEEMGQAARKLMCYDGIGVWNIHIFNFFIYLGLSLVAPGMILPMNGHHFGMFVDEKGHSEEDLKIKEKRIKEICADFEGVDFGADGAEYNIKMTHKNNYVQHLYSHGLRVVTKQLADAGVQPKQQTYSYWYVPAVKWHELYDTYERIVTKYGKWNQSGLPACLSWARPPAILIWYGAWFYNAFDPEDIEVNRKIWKEYTEGLTKLGCVPYCIGANYPKETLTNQGVAYELMKKVKSCLDPKDLMNPDIL